MAHKHHLRPYRARLFAFNRVVVTYLCNGAGGLLSPPRPPRVASPNLLASSARVTSQNIDPHCAQDAPQPSDGAEMPATSAPLSFWWPSPLPFHAPFPIPVILRMKECQTAFLPSSSSPRSSKSGPSDAPPPPHVVRPVRA